MKMNYLDGVMVILSTAASFRLTELCNIRVCLTWSVRMGHLNLICRVNTLYHTVVFSDNRRREQGFCVNPHPMSECHSYNVTVTQNTRTNVTILTITGNIDEHVNGEWTCAHGTNVDAAIVNVTVLTIEGTAKEQGTAREQDKKCWEPYLLWPLVILFCVILATVLIYKRWRMRNQELENSREHEDPDDTSESTVMKSVRSSPVNKESNATIQTGLL